MEQIFEKKSPSEPNEKLKRKFVIEDVITKDVETAEPCLVQFSNGVVKNYNDIKGRIYRNNSFIYIRRRKERVLDITTSCLSYAGNNFDSSVNKVFKEKLFLGVLDKETNKMKLIEMSSFIVHPKIDAKANVKLDTENAALTYREKQKKLNEEFGGRRGRSLLSRRQDYDFDIQNMSAALQTALENVAPLEEHDLEEATYENVLPPCHREAKSVKDVYVLQEIISDEELVTFNDEAIEWLDGNRDNSGYSPLFQQALASAKCVSEEEEQAKLVCVALFMEQLIKLLRPKFSEEVSLNCSKLIEWKILGTFTKGKPKKRLKEDEDRLIAYIVVLALIINNFEVDWAALSSSVGVKAERLVNVVRVVGAAASRERGTIRLKIPLVKVNPEIFRRMKRK